MWLRALSYELQATTRIRSFGSRLSKMLYFAARYF
jgi:hypothetical protein